MSLNIDIQPTTTSNLLWSFSPDRPPRPNVKIVFHGLIAFCYNTRSKECEVAFNRNDSDHQFVITVREKNRPPFYTYSPGPRVTIELGIDGRANDARFYYQGSKDDFDLNTEPPENFPRLLDFEMDDAYNTTHEKIDEAFTSKLYLRNGAVHTHQHTNSTFASVGYPKIFHVLSHVAKYVASDIQLEPSDKDKLYLKIDGTNVIRPGDIDPAKQYEIYFFNDCLDAGGRKCVDSDFHLNFDFVDIPTPLQFGLLTLSPGQDEAPAGLSIFDGYKPLSNDATPCMSVGFGQTDGFPAP